MDVYVDGKRIRLDPARAIGKGGEADVYALDTDTAIKLFKGPDHPDFIGMPALQSAAAQRLDLHQQKLRLFPTLLPTHVVRPQKLVTTRDGTRVIGYVMVLVRDAEVLARARDAWRDLAGDAQRRQVFIDLAQTVAGVHRAGVVLGDINDLNILVRGDEAWVIDADSFQFGPFPCPVFTARFLDPRLVTTANGGHLVFDAGSDWYAYNVMLFEALLGVHPFGGVHRPLRPSCRIAPEQRAAARLPVWHPEVCYPRHAAPLETLPDDLLAHFDRVFLGTGSSEAPTRLLLTMSYTVCTQCGATHARLLCPFCHAGSSRTVAPPAPTAVHGAFTGTTQFTTAGRIITAVVLDGRLHFLVHDSTANHAGSGRWVREDGRTVLAGPDDRRLHFWLDRTTTWIGHGNEVVALDATGKPTQRQPVDVVDGVPQFACVDGATFRLAGGTLWHEAPAVPGNPLAAGPRALGSFLPNLTRFWVGPEFGLGFYRAGQVQVAFVFDTHTGTVNDTVPLPRWPGQLVEITCVFATNVAWLFSTSRENGVDVKRCVAVRADGTVLAAAATAGDDPAWLQPTRGRCAIHDSLFVITDHGLERVRIDHGVFTVTRRFPDTIDLMRPDDLLVPGPDGLFVIGPRSIARVTRKESPHV